MPGTGSRQPVSVVSNASPLIACERLGLAQVYATLFGEVHIPPAVRHEVFATAVLPSWVREQPVSQPLAAQLLQGRLGAGEREALALALEVQADLVLMDELAGRRIATSVGLRLMGTLGVLLLAKRHQLISAVKPLIDQLLAVGFYADDELVQQVVEAAGER